MTEARSSGPGVNESVEFRIVRMSVVNGRQGVNRYVYASEMSIIEQRDSVDIQGVMYTERSCELC